MKWFIVVLFYTLQGDVYIFTEPTFDSYDECYGSITDPKAVPGYVQKLVFEYGRLMPIQALNCLDEGTIKQILAKMNEEEA